jgi:hypothetical protein
MPELFDPAGLTDNDPTDGVATMPVLGGMSTCPDIVGFTKLSILSCFGLSNALFEFRQGDTQPPLSLQIIDGNGNAIALTGATVTACYIVPGQQEYCQQSPLAIQSDGVTAKCERGVDDFITQNPGRYYFVVTARWPDGTGISAPDNGEAEIVVNPAW